MSQGKTDQHRSRGSKGHREQKANEAEQITECEQREHEPHRMQPDAVADQFGRKHIAFEELTGKDLTE